MQQDRQNTQQSALLQQRPAPIVIGSIVTLKGEPNPWMVVDSIASSDRVVCVWIDGNLVIRHEFAVAALELVR